MATAAIHQGPYQSIPADASPGLLWLKSFLPVIDSLNVEDHSALPKYLDANAVFAINSSDPKTAEQLLPMLAMRSMGVSRFLHDVQTVWDVSKEEGQRTVLYESTSTTVFKADEEGQEIKVKEFNVMELVPGADGELKAVALRTYMDPTAVSARAKVMMARKET